MNVKNGRAGGMEATSPSSLQRAPPAIEGPLRAVQSNCVLIPLLNSTVLYPGGRSRWANVKNGRAGGIRTRGLFDPND
jgi:hypothetical protein